MQTLGEAFSFFVRALTLVGDNEGFQDCIQCLDKLACAADTKVDELSIRLKQATGPNFHFAKAFSCGLGQHLLEGATDSLQKRTAAQKAMKRIDVVMFMLVF